MASLTVISEYSEDTGQGTSWQNQALTSHRVSRCLFIKKALLFALTGITSSANNLHSRECIIQVRCLTRDLSVYIKHVLT